MVSVANSLDHTQDVSGTLDALAEGLDDAGRASLEHAWQLMAPLYDGHQLPTGEPYLQHGVGQALLAAMLRLDLETRLAALLFAWPEFIKGTDRDCRERIEKDFPGATAALVEGLRRLDLVRPVSQDLVSRAQQASSADEVKAQAEVLRKMVLAMVDDVRVVILRLASRVQTLRFLSDKPGPLRDNVAREAQQLYAPLANRLGIWQLKWELEDLSLRFLEPAAYKSIAKQLDEKRAEREHFIREAVAQLVHELSKHGVEAEVYGRPKHIYSIWNKMRAKHLDFSEVYDVRALRVIVDDVKDCYTALGVVHQLWTPIPREFDDYISHPKGNNYRSLHTAVFAEDGRALEVQIRTHEMHQHAELGVAAHWRYKESGASVKSSSNYDDKIAWLRQLLSWRDEIADSEQWVEQFKRAALDDTIYVLTPQGKVIDLPRGSTPLDFAYRLHTDLGHRCRGAKVDGHLVTLNTELDTGQKVEIVSAKQGGPSRDWLNPQQGYLATASARAKVKRWFAQLEEAETLATGRAFVQRELQRLGATQTNVDDLAHTLGFANHEALYLAAGHEEIGPRQIEVAVRGEAPATQPAPEIATRRSRAGARSDDVLVVGVGQLMYQLGRCCKPAPPDRIGGFVTRGRGISVHRLDCHNFIRMLARSPERVIEATWGAPREESVFPVDVQVLARDRQGLLRDISEVLSREKINVTAVRTQSKNDQATMGFTLEVRSVTQLNRVLGLLRDLSGVFETRRV